MSQQKTVAMAILDSPNEWVATAEIATTTGFDRHHCSSYVCELRHLKLIESRRNGSATEHRALPTLAIYVGDSPREFKYSREHRIGQISDIPVMRTLGEALLA